MNSPQKKAAPTTETASMNILINDQHFTTSAHLQEADPLIGWFGLAAGVKESRLRKKKRGWQRGSVDLFLLLAINAITWALSLVGGSV
jgi:hypothetical protein